MTRPAPRVVEQRSRSSLLKLMMILRGMKIRRRSVQAPIRSKPGPGLNQSRFEGGSAPEGRNHRAGGSSRIIFIYMFLPGELRNSHQENNEEPSVRTGSYTILRRKSRGEILSRGDSSVTNAPRQAQILCFQREKRRTRRDPPLKLTEVLTWQDWRPLDARPGPPWRGKGLSLIMPLFDATL